MTKFNLGLKTFDHEKFLARFGMKKWLKHLPVSAPFCGLFLSVSNRNYFLKKPFLQDPFYEKFSRRHAETHDSAKKPCRSTHSFLSSSDPELAPKVTDFGTFLARRAVLSV